MSQPKWKNLWSTDYSALFEDETGAYPPELEIAQEYENEQGETMFQVYRFPLDPLKEIWREGHPYLVPEAWDESWPHPLPDYEDWFVEDLHKVAESVGTTEEELRAHLVSGDPNKLASAYEAIGGYHGYDNLDSEPETWTEEEMSENWP